VTDQVDRAVADTAMRQLWIHTLIPNARRIEAKINSHLCRRYLPGFTVKFDYSEVKELQDNRESILKQAKDLRDLGYTINEINDKLNLGMEEITDEIGDMRLVPSNLIPVDDLLIPLDDQSKQINNDDKLDKAIEIINKEETLNKAARNYRRKYLILHRKYEKLITAKLRKYFSKELITILNTIHNKASNIDEALLLNQIREILLEGKDKVAELLRPIYTDATLDGSKLALAAIGSTHIEPRINEMIVNEMVNKIRNINNYTYKFK